MLKPKTIISTLMVVSCTLIKAHAQNLFPKMVDSCHVQSFCLDCGNPKATYDSVSFSEIPKKIAAAYNIASARGGIMFQVMVDSLGIGCVISHTDVSNNRITQDIVKYLNACKWVPAVEKGKTVRSSINVLFRFADGAVTGSIERVNNEQMTTSMRNPGTPTIYNRNYTYTNPSLKNYKLTVWQKENSGLPQDMSQHCVIDKSNIVWYGTFDGLVKFDGRHFVKLDGDNSPFKEKENIFTMAVDKDDNKWVCVKDGIYRYDNNKWEKLDSTKVGVNTVYDIVVTPENALLFCDDKGLVVYKDGKYTVFNQQKVKEMPSNRVYWACRDKQNRLWIGTFSGSLMIGPDGKVTAFNNTETPIKGTCLTGMAEDAEGNEYFTLYDYTSSKSRDRETEGLAKLSKDGKWTHYNDKNSGLPANHINAFFYDKFENILWLGTNDAGLVRYDLKDGWEVYNNTNSNVPSCYIYQISQNSNGELYISTYNGMLRVAKQ